MNQFFTDLNNAELLMGSKLYLILSKMYPSQRETERNVPKAETDIKLLNYIFILYDMLKNYTFISYIILTSF